MSIHTIDYTMQLRQQSAIDKKKRVVYARPVLRGKVGNEEITEELVRSTTLTASDIAAVLTGLGERLAEHLRQGELVTLKGIGSFSVRIKSEQGKKKNGRVKMTDLHVSGVLFRPATDFLETVQEVEFNLTAGPTVRMPSEEKISTALQKHFSKTGFITSSDIMEELHVSRRRSRQILTQLVDGGVLTRRGKGPMTHYVLVQPSTT